MEEIKKNYTKIGLSLFVVVAITVGLQFLVEYGLTYFYGEEAPFLYETWFTLLLSCVPLHFIAIPVGAKMLKKVPTDKKEKTKLSLKEFLCYFVMCLPLMYGGNILGNTLSNIISKGTAVNPLNSIVLNDDLLIKILFICILAPIFEELLFRKIIIDHTRQYGERTAIIFSAIAFGLFHMNLYQIFYAFGIGLIFAFVYSKTKNIKYTVIMHSIINFFGSIVVPLLISNINLEFWNNVDIVNEMHYEEVLTEFITFIPLLIYLAIVMIFSIIGFVMLFAKRNLFICEKTENEIPKKYIFKTVYLNYGSILFELITIGFTIFRLFK